MKKVDKRILITGINSLLGKYLVKALRPNFEIWGTLHTKKSVTNIRIAPEKLFKTDITSTDDVKKAIQKSHPAIIIHLASLSNIDYCESHPQEAYTVNVQGTQNICRVLKDLPADFIFASSNAIFDGLQPPYQETDSPTPLSVYGKTKAAAETIIQENHLPATIVRFTTLFGWPPKEARDNDLSYYLQRLHDDKALYLVNDRFFNPVSALTAAEGIAKIIQQQFYGIIHIAGKDRVSRYTWVKTIIRVFAIKNHPLLIPVASDYFPDIAPRPHDATLSTHKMERILQLIPQPLFQELRLLARERPAKEFKQLI